jgi:hypothetical protein
MDWRPAPMRSVGAHPAPRQALAHSIAQSILNTGNEVLLLFYVAYRQGCAAARCGRVRPMCRERRTRTSFCGTARSTCAAHDPAAVKYLGPAAAQPAAARKHPAVALAGRRPGRPTAKRHSCGPVTLCDSYRHAALRYACDPAPRRDSARPAPRRHSTRAPLIALVAGD